MAKVQLVSEDTVKEYHEIAVQIRALEKQKAALRPKIYAYVMDNGKQDEKGSKMVEYPGYRAKLTARSSYSLDTVAAETLLKERGLWDECKLELLDQSKLEKVVKEGKVKLAELDKISKTDVSYALKVDRR